MSPTRAGAARPAAGTRLAPPDAGLLAALEAALPGAVRSRATDRLAYAHDASHFLLTPEAVVVPDGAGQVATLLRAAARHGAALTFRSGGTSLSGQAGTSAVLVDTRRHFREVEVLDDGARVRVQPGVTLRQVNQRLARHGRRLGPDPASEVACTIGGVVADNSSGMTCGTQASSYATLESAVLVLPSGTVVDTGAPDADARLRAVEPALAAGLERLRDRVRRDPASVATLRRQFSMKNTMGYGLNAFLDHGTPARLLTALVVGSEGTLAFLAEATFRTVPLHRHAATGLVVFGSLHDATASLPALLQAGPAAVELLDAESLRVAQRDPAADQVLRALAVREHAALLVEWQEAEVQELEAAARAAAGVLAGLPVAAPARLSTDAAGRAALWHVRKGLYATVAGARASGTTALLEDVAVPVPDLADLCADLTTLFARHGYERSVVFGHAKDGNLHFMLTERFEAGGHPERYAAFTEDLVDAVLARGGTLKAEHGTGRVMAPYVRRQYGDELYEVMVELKRLCDPAGVLAPGVVITDDATLHLRDLKVVEPVEPEVDRCVECGYCEPVCPSRDLTTTPRQRIVLRREMAAAEASGDTALLATLREEYGYDAVDTCAVDGMCATACPVLIDTGDLTRRLRAEAAGRPARTAWSGAARAWGATTTGMARALDAAAVVPAPLLERTTDALRAVADHDAVPQWRRDLPSGGRRRRPLRAEDADAVYVPSCLGTVFAPADGGAGVEQAVRALAGRAGVRLRVPDDVAGLCCGTPWSSKGMAAGHATVAARVRRSLVEATSSGRLPVVSDSASCSEGFGRLLGAAGPGLTVLDAVPFVERLLPGLTVTRRLRSLALHPTCSSRRLGTDDAMLRVARAVADEVVVPDSWQCCAFAGDRGLLHPELTASATREQAAEVVARDLQAHASVGRTCEIGMTRATGRPYRHLLELVDEATRPQP